MWKCWSAEEWAARAPSAESDQPESQVHMPTGALSKPGTGAALKAVTVKERLALCCATERQRLTFGKVHLRILTGHE